VLPDEAERLMKTPFAVIQVSLSCNKLRHLPNISTSATRSLGVFESSFHTTRCASL